jgi:monoamine oxidase
MIIMNVFILMQQQDRRNTTTTTTNMSTNNNNNNHEYDCIIIGAGVSGLSAALELKDRGINNYLILEADDHVGGRLRSLESKAVRNKEFMEKHNIEPNDDPVRVDVGGQWVGVTQTHVLDMIKRFNLTMYEQDEEGDSVMMTGDVVQRYGGVIPPVSYMSLVDLQWGMWSSERISRNIPLDKPWEMPDASKFDAMTAYSFMDQKFWTQQAKDLYTMFIRCVFCCEPSEISFLFLLYYVHTAGGVDPLISARGGAQDLKIKGGAQSIPLAIAKEVGFENIKLNQPVQKIDYKGEGAIITTRSGEHFRSKFVIMAVPPHMGHKIHYSPPLPAIRDQFVQRFAMGYVIKYVACFKTKWWREKGYSGFGMSINNEETPSECWYDATDHNSLIGFILADKARVWGRRTRDERKEALLKQFSVVFETDLEFVKDQCVDYLDNDWGHEEFIRGSYGGFTQPSAFVSCGEGWKDPIGPIHIAGTEYGTKWNGYMSGGIESGQRAAKEVLEKLGVQSEP